MSNSSSSPKKGKSSGNNIFDRLTDPSKYTGTHVHRFDAEGKGRGLAGRQNIVDFKGNTNTKVIETISSKSPTRKPIVSPGLGQQKFGTQATKAPVITLFRNGDKYHGGETYTVKQVKTLDQLLDKITPIVKLPTGAVRKLYKEGGKVTVKSLDELEDGKKYLACGGEKPAEQDKLPMKWLE